MQNEERLEALFEKLLEVLGEKTGTITFHPVQIDQRIEVKGSGVLFGNKSLAIIEDCDLEYMVGEEKRKIGEISEKDLQEIESCLEAILKEPPLSKHLAGVKGGESSVASGSVYDGSMSLLLDEREMGEVPMDLSNFVEKSSPPSTPLPSQVRVTGSGPVISGRGSQELN